MVGKLNLNSGCQGNTGLDGRIQILFSRHEYSSPQVRLSYNNKPLILNGRVLWRKNHDYGKMVTKYNKRKTSYILDFWIWIWPCHWDCLYPWIIWFQHYFDFQIILQEHFGSRVNFLFQHSLLLIFHCFSLLLLN